MDFQEIYETCYPLVYAFLMKQCGNPHHSEELTQETFARALKAIGRFEGNCRVETWLCQIAKNTWISECRKKRRFAPLSGPESASPEADPVDRLIASESAMEVLRAAHELDETAKEVFLLRACGERDFGSIGSLFGKSPSWARVTYHRAKLKVLAAIQKKEGT